LIDKMQKARGYMLPPWVYLTEKDPDFMEAYNTLYERGLTDGKAFRQSERVHRHRHPGLPGPRGCGLPSLPEGFALGASPQELLEAVESAMVPGGGPTLAIGLRALVRIEEEEKKGIGKPLLPFSFPRASRPKLYFFLRL